MDILLAIVGAFCVGGTMAIFWLDHERAQLLGRIERMQATERALRNALSIATDHINQIRQDHIEPSLETVQSKD